MGCGMTEQSTLESMKSARRWLFWRLSPEGRKIPYYINGKPRSAPLDGPEDSKQLVTYQEAVSMLDGPMAGQWFELGFALGPDGNGGNWQGFDLDDVSKNGLEEIANTLPGYVEYSPSGQGVHAIGYGQRFENLGSDGSGTEAYSTGRYFTFTGNSIRDGALADLSPFITTLLVPHRKKTSARQTTHQAAQPPGPADASIIEDLRTALTFIDADPYDIWFRTLIALKTLGESGRELAREWSARSEMHTDEEFEKKWAGLKPERTSYKAIFTEAASNGWNNPGYSQDVPLVDISGLLKFMEEKLGPLQFDNISKFSIISTEEWTHSRLHPNSIVENYLFADVGILIAPGGVGKTTLILYEAICLVLGIQLYGRIIHKPGRVVIVSAEDSREQIIARLVRIASSMELSTEQIEHIKNNVLIEYVGGEEFRLCKMENDLVITSQHVENLIDSITPLTPSLLVIDPAVSFGVGESRVNDAEQGLIKAARRIRDAVGCCVRLVHHTGKQNAREKTTDQYSGRGGSAMADGARMVAVLKRMEADEWLKVTGEALPENADGLLLALPKLSYAPAQPHIYLERIGFSYRHVVPTVFTVEDKRAVIDRQVIDFLQGEEMQNHFHSKSTLEQSEALSLSRNDIRTAIARLEVAGRITFTIEPGRGQGRRIRLVNYSPEPIASNWPFSEQWAR